MLDYNHSGGGIFKHSCNGKVQGYDKHTLKFDKITYIVVFCYQVTWNFPEYALKKFPYVWDFVTLKTNVFPNH